MIKNSVAVIVFVFLFTGCSSVFRALKITPSKKLKQVSFANEPLNSEYKFLYPDTTNNAYLRKLRVNYNLDSVIGGMEKDMNKILALVDWTNKQWSHSGSNTPSKSDPITILEEAKKGNQFRCVEYGIVSAAALNSVGIPSRVLGLKTADVEKVKFGAGHVVAEAYSKELKKWIFIDGQFNGVPFLNDVPLNAVEFKKAITSDIVNLKIINAKGEFNEKDKEYYITWVSKYLFYFDVSFDSRYNTDKDRLKINNKSSLMLVPLNEINPTVFQKKYEINYCLYTNNLNDFYRKPN